MSLKLKIINIYKKKLDILKKHNTLYFNNDSPLITDAEYDKLKKELSDKTVPDVLYPFFKAIRNLNYADTFDYDKWVLYFEVFE